MVEFWLADLWTPFALLTGDVSLLVVEPGANQRTPRLLDTASALHLWLDEGVNQRTRWCKGRQLGADLGVAQHDQPVARARERDVQQAAAAV